MIYRIASITERQITGSIAPMMLRLAIPGFADAAARVIYLGMDAVFVAPLGVDALAGLGLVLPFFLLIMTVSNAGMGVGVAGAVARALGAGDRESAGFLAWQAAVLGLALGLLFMVGLLVGTLPLYRVMGASPAAIAAAEAYGQVLFVGAPVICLSGMLANVFRGAGQTHVAAAGIVAGEVAHVALGLPLVQAFGMSGAAMAGMAAFAVSSAVYLGWLVLRPGPVVLARRHVAFRRRDVRAILPLGLIASINAAMLQAVNLSIVGMAASFGPTVLAGVALAVRFETLMLPIVFSFGAALVAMVGANVGAGEAVRAKQIAWIGAAAAAMIGYGFAVLGTVGSGAWLDALTPDTDVGLAAVAYLRWLAPSYPFYAIGMALFFSAQGAGQAGAIFGASVLRSVLAIVGGWAAVAIFGGDVGALGATVGASVLVFATIAAVAVHRARWEGPAARATT